MRRPLFVANWKMHMGPSEAGIAAEQMRRFLADFTGTDLAIAPPFTSLFAVRQKIEKSPIMLAAQDVFWEEKGAFTGEVSPSMLKESGCTFVIVGHSERRQFFGETDETAGKKVRACLKAGLFPILCVGETLSEREGGKTFDVLARQVIKGLQGIPPETLPGIAIAYEPVWAIGTGKSATPEEAEKGHAFIRGVIAEGRPAFVPETIRIIYGGSVTPEKVSPIMAQKNVDGALVGGASLSPVSFAAIVRAGIEN